MTGNFIEAMTTLEPLLQHLLTRTRTLDDITALWRDDLLPSTWTVPGVQLDTLALLHEVGLTVEPSAPQDEYGVHDVKSRAKVAWVERALNPPRHVWGFCGDPCETPDHSAKSLDEALLAVAQEHVARQVAHFNELTDETSAAAGDADADADADADDWQDFAFNDAAKAVLAAFALQPVLLSASMLKITTSAGSTVGYVVHHALRREKQYEVRDHAHRSVDWCADIEQALAQLAGMLPSAPHAAVATGDAEADVDDADLPGELPEEPVARIPSLATVMLELLHADTSHDTLRDARLRASVLSAAGTDEGTVLYLYDVDEGGDDCPVFYITGRVTNKGRHQWRLNVEWMGEPAALYQGRDFHETLRHAARMMARIRRDLSLETEAGDDD